VQTSIDTLSRREQEGCWETCQFLPGRIRSLGTVYPDSSDEPDTWI
jgi:hypothetical protein